MSLEHILLGLLAKPASGYDLKRQFDEAIHYFWSADLAQLYRTLQRLEEKQWLRSKPQPSSRGPAKREYRRTAAGRRVLLEWLRSEPQLGSERFAYIAQLVFMHQLHDLKATLTFVRKLKKKLLALRDLFQHIEHEETRQGLVHQTDEDFHGLLGLRMGIRSITAKIDWCDEAMALIEQRIEQKGRQA